MFADGHEDIYQLLDKELGIMDEEKLEKISEYIEIKGDRINDLAQMTFGFSR